MEHLDLFEASLPHELPASVRITQAPVQQNRLELTLPDGNKITLLSGNVSIGRNKSCDIIARNQPIKGEAWSVEKLQEMNQKISASHCSIEISKHEVLILHMIHKCNIFEWH